MDYITTTDVSLDYHLTCSNVTSIFSIMAASLQTIHCLKKSFCIILMITRFQLEQSKCVLKEPAPGECNVARNPHENDTRVYPASEGACNFTGSGQAALCSYRQGCRDKDMSNWTASNGVATVNQISVTCGMMESYSILESPWLNFATVSFVQFSFLTVLPYRIDIFFATKDGGIQTIVDRSSNINNYLNYRNVTVTKSVGKILFRAFGGSGPPVSKLELYGISIFQDTFPNPETRTESTSASSSVYKTNTTSTTLTPAENHSTDSLTIASDHGTNGPVIGGIVVAVVLILALIVIAIIIWRRRIHKKAKSAENIHSQIGVQNTGNANIVPNDQVNGRSSSQPYSSLTVSQANQVGDYIELHKYTPPGGRSEDPDDDTYEPFTAVDSKVDLTHKILCQPLARVEGQNGDDSQSTYDVIGELSARSQYTSLKGNTGNTHSKPEPADYYNMASKPTSADHPYYNLK